MTSIVRAIAPPPLPPRHPVGEAPSDSAADAIVPLDERVAASEALTPEGLIALTARRLGSLDDGIAHLLEGLDGAAGASEHLSTQREAVETLSAALRVETNDDLDEEVSLGEVVVTWRGRELPAHRLLEEVGLAEDATVDRDGSNFTASPSNPLRSDDEISIELLRSLDQRLEHRQQELNTDNELSLIALQDRMQSRSRVLEMTTNLLEAMRRGKDVIVGNLR